MFEIVAVTNRKLCKVDFLQQIETIAKAKPDKMILREKDLSETEYSVLAKQVKKICDRYQVKCILHTYIETARELAIPSIHLPMPLLKVNKDKLSDFTTIGSSIHSIEEACLAQELGAHYITAGHIFATDCKKGVAPRGICFLEEVVEQVNIPVYAIGGIQPSNIKTVMKTTAAGACIMSGFMKCHTPEELMKLLS